MVISHKAQAVQDLGITKERLLVCAIHTHAAPPRLYTGRGAAESGQ